MISKKRLLKALATAALLAVAVIILYWLKVPGGEGNKRILPDSGTGQTLINFAKYVNNNSKARLAKIESINSSDVRMLLSTVDIDDYVESEGGCEREPNNLYLFGANQVSGRFIPGGGKQSLVTIEIGSCGELRFNAARHAFLVVNGAIWKHFDACMNNAMLIDVPGKESLQDILLICGWFHMGTLGERAAVYGYRAKQFDSVLALYGYEDNCNALGQKGEIIWSILRKGNVSGQYREDVRRTSCAR